MGMTIDEQDRYTNACIKYLQKNMECVNFRDYIIERLNKYQKIEQIIEVWHQDIYAKDFECVAEIAEVVEDEKS